MRRVLLFLLFLVLIPCAYIHAQPFAPTGSVRTCTDCDTTACTSQQMIAIEPVPGTGQGLPYICDTTTGLFVPWPGGAGGGAPISASYLTLGLNGTLTAERVFTCDPSLTCADTGANGTLTPALNMANPNTWMATQTFNIPSITEAIIIDHAASASPGVSDGNPIVMTGRSDDGTPHRLDWRFFVDAETNAGQSSLHFQQRNDAGSFTQKFAIGSLGMAVIGPKIGAGAQEVLRLWTDPTTPALNDGPRIVFHAEDSLSNDTQYGQLQVLASDVTDGTEDGDLSVNLTINGSTTSVFSLFGTSGGNMRFGRGVDENRDLTFNRGVTDGVIRYDGSLFDFINGGISGGDVTSGTVDEARLDANAVMDNEANAYTGGLLQDFGAAAVKLPITDTALAAQGRARVASTGTGSYYYDTAQRQHAITASDIANSQAGSCTFAAGVSCAVTLPVTEADASYLVVVSCSDSRIFWADTKLTTGFTINASASTSGVCDWRLIR